MTFTVAEADEKLSLVSVIMFGLSSDPQTQAAIIHSAVQKTDSAASRASCQCHAVTSSLTRSNGAI